MEKQFTLSGDSSSLGGKPMIPKKLSKIKQIFFSFLSLAVNYRFPFLFIFAAVRSSSSLILCKVELSLSKSHHLQPKSITQTNPEQVLSRVPKYRKNDDMPRQWVCMCTKNVLICCWFPLLAHVASFMGMGSFSQLHRDQMNRERWWGRNRLIFCAV